MPELKISSLRQVVITLKTTSPGFVNYGYIIVDTKTASALLVDPAWDLQLYTETLQELQLNPKGILLTHSHHDHINLVNPLLNQYELNVFMSKEEIEYYQFQCENLHPLDDMEEIQLGDSTITALLTPGHTKGSLCFLGHGALFTGDTIFIEGCGSCDFDGGSPEEMFDSIQKIKSIVAPQTKVYPGHSFGKVPGVPLEQLMKENIYFLLNKKSSFVTFRMRRNQRCAYEFK